MDKKSISVIILTFNEELHIKRCIDSAKKISNDIIIVDSYSSDSTIEIAKLNGVRVYKNEFVNHAQQFQWALDEIEITSEWIMKLDADEYLTDFLIQELSTLNVDDNITGLKVKCRVYFLDTWIKHGSYYPLVLLRIWRNGIGFMEQKWVDEHIQLKRGSCKLLESDIVDHNLNNLTWWTNKQNGYATKEAIVRLDQEFHFLPENKASLKANKIFYLKLPLFLRGFIYYIYRYVIRGGFRDGIPGLIWHSLQGLWLQLLVDSKIVQIKKLMEKGDKSILEILENDYNIKIK